jgi:hypothetical protein
MIGRFGFTAINGEMNPSLMGNQGVWSRAYYFVPFGIWGGRASGMAFDANLRVVED